MIAAHTDVVGSLLRPPELLKARSEVATGKMTQAAFKTIEDQAVDKAVALQETVGLQVVTDGEMRRLSFQSQMTEAVAGFGEYDLNAFLWGDWRGDGAAGHLSLERPKNLGRCKQTHPQASPLSGGVHLPTIADDLHTEDYVAQSPVCG